MKGFANERFSIERFLTFVRIMIQNQNTLQMKGFIPKDFANASFFT